MRLEWNRAGERLFETGIERGVLYPQSGSGVAWNGLISVNESVSGGEAKPFYIDGYKFANRSSPEEYAATISAFTYPQEFAVCDGSAHLGRGLYLTQQRRQSFGLSYRTKVGNDTVGESHGYKIHLVYNALASPTGRNYQSVSSDPEAATFDWNVTTRPIKIAGRRPSPHLIIDSTLSTPELMASLEDILYGSSSTPPRLPLPTEVVALFAEWPELLIQDNGDGTFTASGPDNVVSLINNQMFQIVSDTATDHGDGTFTVTSY